ncbi:MAG: molecular chaperone GrpE [Nocardioidaceae bacterium]|nr:molecular chaperone GrpE [Nocardioidaceae bacterium]
MTEQHEVQTENVRADEGQGSAPPEAPDPAGALRDAEDQLRRALADLDNVRKRFEREVTRERTAERARAAAAWLPVVDNLERALEHAGAEGGAVTEGVRAVLEQALHVLERFGFPRFEDMGELFDPTRHEAMGAIASEAPPGTVVATVRPGYGTTDNVLRPAGVVVARGSG